MRYVVLFGLAILIGFVFGFLDVSEPLGISLAVLVTLVIFLYLFVLPVYLEKDIGKIERFLLKNKKKPIFKLYYGIGNQLDQDVKESIDALLKKYKQPSRQALFKTLYALYEKDILRAKQEVKEIKPMEYQNYYQAVLSVEEGNMEKAQELRGSIKTEWMKHALSAAISEKTGDHDAFITDIQKAFEKTRGVQRYLIYKQFEKDLKKLT